MDKKKLSYMNWWTCMFLKLLPMTDVVRSCNIRFFTTEAKLQCKIPSHCRRGGTGDLFYVKHHLPGPTLMKKGWNPADDEIQASP